MDWIALTAIVVVVGVALTYSVFGASGDEGLPQLIESMRDTWSAEADDLALIETPGGGSESGGDNTRNR